MKAITREEKIISGENLTPITRKEMFLAKASGQNIQTPTPITREEYFLSKITGGGGSGVVVCNAETPRNSNYIEDIKELKISYPNATSVGEIAFDGNMELHSIDLPNVTSIDDYAFRDCIALTSINIPEVTSIGNHTFKNCTALTSIDLPKVMTLREQAFINCTALTSIDLPNATTILNSAFWGCTALTSINLPKVTSILSGVFINCTALTSINLPNAMDIEGKAFSGGTYLSGMACTSLKCVDLGKATSIGDETFMDCVNLDTLILRNTETMCSIILTSILGTKIATVEGVPTGEGFIYVPTSLYENYVANFTEQATYLLMETGLPQEEAVIMAEQIAIAILRKIEDYPEICGVA